MTAPLIDELLAEIDDDPVHLTCCDDNRSMCGLDVTEHNWVPDDDESAECRYCAYLIAEVVPCCEGCDA